MINAEDVVNYLKDNPSFFEQNKDVIGDLKFSDDQQPFHQRQIDVLKKRHADEQRRFQLVVDSAKNNQELDQSVHDFARRLLAWDQLSGEQNLDKVPAAESTITSHFGITAASICLLNQSDGSISAEEVGQLLLRVRHGNSICDDRVANDLLLKIFGQETAVASCAFVPLLPYQYLSGNEEGSTESEVIGILVMGDNDVERFKPGMGSIYLDRMGQLVAAFLS